MRIQCGKISTPKIPAGRLRNRSASGVCSRAGACQRCGRDSGKDSASGRQLDQTVRLNLVAPFAPRQQASFSQSCLGIYNWLQAMSRLRRRVSPSSCSPCGTSALDAEQERSPPRPRSRLHGNCLRHCWCGKGALALAARPRRPCYIAYTRRRMIPQPR